MNSLSYFLISKNRNPRLVHKTTVNQTFPEVNTFWLPLSLIKERGLRPACRQAGAS